MTKNEILSLIPSKDFKKAILDNKYEMSDELYFKIAYIYSPNLEARINVCSDFIGFTKDSVLKANIRQIYNHLASSYAEFKNGGANIIYEAKIKEKDCDPSSYLAYSYNDAYNKLEAMLLCNYKDIDYDLSTLEISITKRGIYPITNPHYEDDVIEVMWFNSLLEPDNLYFSKLIYDDLSSDSIDLIDNMLWEYTDLPIFFRDGSLIKYGNRYGIVLHNKKDRVFEAIAYVVRLDEVNDDSLYEKRDGYYPILNIHTHVPYTELELVDKKEVNSNILASYNKFIKFYREYKKAKVLCHKE